MRAVSKLQLIATPSLATPCTNVLHHPPPFIVLHYISPTGRRALVSSSPSPNPSKRHSTAPACARDLRTSEWSTRTNASVPSTAATATTLMSPAGSAHLPDAPIQPTPAPAATAPRSAGASKPSRCIGSRKTPERDLRQHRRRLATLLK